MDAGSHQPAPAWLRHYRRYWRPFLNKHDKARIVAVVAEQKARTTGTIRVHIVAQARTRDMLAFTRAQFEKLGLDKTPARNGVLILISRWDHQFAIWGDEGLHATAGQPLWEHARATLLAHFAVHRHGDGIVACVRAVGDELARHFPKAPADHHAADTITEAPQRGNH